MDASQKQYQAKKKKKSSQRRTHEVRIYLYEEVLKCAILGI
jgi:hypothetical protein